MNENKQSELLVYGYLREVMDATQDHGSIISIIETFTQLYAKFIDANDDDFDETDIHFGDIIIPKFASVKAAKRSHKIPTKYSIVDKDGNITCGTKYKIGSYGWAKTPYNIDDHYYSYITIPYDICYHLYNAPFYYSKIFALEMKQLGHWRNYREDQDERKNMTFDVRYNDNFIIQTFGDTLNENYKSIKIIFESHKMAEKNVFKFYINFDGTYSKIFHMNEGWTVDDIESFYKLRKNKNNLVKIKVTFDTSVGLLDDSFCSVYSLKWDICNISVGYNVVSGMYYIGPKQEKKK
eukprot:450366_1